MLDEIRQRLSVGLETGRFAGLLFHGSGEPWEGDPQPGGDGLFWTATSPVIAQQYIPASGSSYIVSRPQSYELSSRVAPERNSFWHLAAKQMTGLEAMDLELDSYGCLRSWRLPEGWPTYGDCVAWLENELGYSWKREYDVIDIKIDRNGDHETLVPADWLMPGTILVTLADDLIFKDLRRGRESDLTDLEYHNVEGFDIAARNGFDGVIINDFAQTDEGNVGHVSYGLNEKGLETREWITIPARRHKYDWRQSDSLTSSVSEWVAAQNSQSEARIEVSPSI